MADQTDLGGGATAELPSSSSSEMEESLATLLHLQQIQKKQEMMQLMESRAVADADDGFRQGLEALVRDHLNTCMAIASCSSSVHDSALHCSSNNNSRPCSSHDTLDNGSVVANMEACNTTDQEPVVQMFQTNGPASCTTHQCALNHHSEGTDTIQEQNSENQNLESADSSVQRQQRSRIFSIWAAEHAQEMITTMERQTREAELLALAGLHTVSTLDASFLRQTLPRDDRSVDRETHQQRRPSSLVQMWRELEEERRNQMNRAYPDQRTVAQMQNQNVESRMISNGAQEAVLTEVRTSEREENEDASGPSAYIEWEQGESETISMQDQLETSVQGSADAGDGEREHVRQIVQRLMTFNQMGSMPSDGQTQNRSVWLDERERERVRELARAWVQATNGQRPDMQWDGQGTNQPEAMMELRDAREENNRSPLQGLSRRERRYLNRQVILNMLMRVERERQRELQLLVEHRAVSDFAHRNRLQSFLRGRFLHSGVGSEEERIQSSATGELGQLRQRRAVSNLREGFRVRLENILRNQNNNRLEINHGNVRNATRQRVISHFNPSVQGNSTRNTGLSEGTSRGWQLNNRSRRVAGFVNAEEPTAYNMELQELLGRRSVTNALASEFRERLDQLIRSFLHTQQRPPVVWDGERVAQADGQRRRRQVQRQQPTGIPPPPPPPPPPPAPHLLWQQELHATWSRSPVHRPSYLEVEGINDLRVDVVKLQQGMSDLHRMLETCIEMQLDLQRSIRQELAGALQIVYDGKAIPEEAIDGSKWTCVKKGICCVCCDRSIDSLLYRCGHMSTCLKCASELIKNSGKCPMCRAPILEVVRAFTVA